MIKLPSIHENCFDRFYFRLNFLVLSLSRVHYHSFQWLLSELGFKQTNLHKGKKGEWEILFYTMNHCKTNNNSTSDDSFLKYFKENETGNLAIWIEHSVCGGHIPADRWLLCRWSNPKRNSLRGSQLLSWAYVSPSSHSICLPTAGTTFFLHYKFTVIIL